MSDNTPLTEPPLTDEQIHLRVAERITELMDTARYDKGEDYDPLTASDRAAAEIGDLYAASLRSARAERDQLADELMSARTERTELLAERDQALHILGDLFDPDPCWFDHHGYCQAHGWLSAGECPHARAKKLLRVEEGPTNV